MAKAAIKPGTYLYPVPAVMVTCGPREKPNIITLAWVGTICSDPPMLSISIRPSRYSNELIKQQGEFAVNLPTVRPGPGHGLLRVRLWSEGGQVCGNGPHSRCRPKPSRL